MSVDLVLNELSLAVPADTAEEGMALMRGLADTMFEAGRCGANKVLRAPRNFPAMLLASAYPVGRWSADKRVPPDYRKLFLVWTTKSPYLDPLTETDADETFVRSEYRYRGQICEGLAIARIIGGLGVSFQSVAEWSSPRIALKAFELDDDGESVEYDCEINHAASATHVRSHEAWIRRQRELAVADGADCCARITELFPRVALCSNARRQLSELGRGEELFAAAYAGLDELSRYASSWQQGGFKAEGLAPCSEESKCTLDEFGDERTFMCPDGLRQPFSWHLKRGRWRIYFIPDDRNRTILVGYIGKHLRTCKFR